MRIVTAPQGTGHGIELRLGSGELLAVAPYPVTVELWDGDEADWAGSPSAHPYDEVREDDGALVGLCRVERTGLALLVTDTWRVGGQDGVTVERRVECTAGAGATGFRTSLSVTAVGEDFDSGTQVFAPPALYDLDDIDGDGLEDYLDTRELVYRDDRLSALAVLLYSPAGRRGLALTREDVPARDEVPRRTAGQQAFLQPTDVGALGLLPQGDTWSLYAAHPFVERARSHALTSEGREPWGAFWPAEPGPAGQVTYGLRLVSGERAVDAVWALWRARAARLAPRRVEVPAPLPELTDLRLAATLHYYREDATTAGFVTNCHPQDGTQLRDVLQYGFTGQNVLTALHVLRHQPTPQWRERALRVVQGFADAAGSSPTGLTHTLYDFATGRRASWWSGLLLPLAYADPAADLRALMGPVYDHMRPVIEALADAPDGTYLRCMAEEHHALLRVLDLERQAGHDHPDWLAAAVRFGDFLLAAQEEDGSWRRAYGFDGQALVEPRSWFGPTELNQKSSTATAVPFLEALHAATGEERWAAAAVRAAEFVRTAFVGPMRANGGVHDSIYTRPQLVDSESVLFCLRACLSAWRLSGERTFADAAVDAARALATWVYLWDVPLPSTSTLGALGFRSTGWSGCDTAGAGYIHPYELHAVPDLYECALLAGDELLATVAELVLHGSNETVETPDISWGYATPGLQEEGLLVSWWLVDDPMFVGTSFGSRGKGEGNKTCLPWIAAVAVDATDEVLRRWETVELLSHFTKSAAGEGAVASLVAVRPDDLSAAHAGRAGRGR